MRRVEMKRKAVFFAAVVMLLVSFVPFSAIAAAEGSDASETVVIGYYSEPNLMDGAAEGEEKSGYCYDYIQEIASHAGFRY